MTTRMKRNRLAAILTATAMGAVIAMPTSVRADDEFGENTPYYEDDAWYDVSEWFDGNDYNPTDEAIGRWDNEVFSFADNATSTDNNKFLNLGGYDDYGYYESRDSDWFYDYYDDGYSYWDNRFYSNYFDIDNDGLYDAYAYYSDTDGDGFYEYYEYVSFDTNIDARSQKQTEQMAKNQQKQMKSTAMQLSGTVTKTKLVDVRGRKHVVAMVNQSNGQAFCVDLGPKRADVQLTVGSQLTTSGHAVKIGDKPVLIASEASTSNQSLAIDRSGKTYQGTIEKTRTVKVRGIEHQLAKVKNENGKMMLVDLGPANALDRDLKKGAQVAVQGVPVKVNDRVILMARRITMDGNSKEIERQVALNR